MVQRDCNQVANEVTARLSEGKGGVSMKEKIYPPDKIEIELKKIEIRLQTRWHNEIANRWQKMSQQDGAQDGKDTYLHADVPKGVEALDAGLDPRAGQGDEVVLPNPLEVEEREVLPLDQVVKGAFH
jgi:hypothetical protein